MSTIISSHNNFILKNDNNKVYSCNCRNKPAFPVENKCLTSKVVYKAEVSNNVNNDKKLYIGLSATPFKDRFRNHNKAFNNERYKNDTELSKYIWDLQDKEIVHQINWSILKLI